MPEKSSPSPGLFVSGTDTGVGKTLVTAAVARLLRNRGRDVVVCKPVATGARPVGGRWLADDTALLADAAGLADEWERVTPWAFPDPVAPPLAARRRGVALTLPAIAGAVRERVRPRAALLVEGIGGLLCPLTEGETVADLVRELGLPLLVVARRSLGTLNHTLLTLEVARGRGLAVAGVVVSETASPAGLADETNVDELRRLGVPVLAVVPHLPGGAREVVPALAAVDWWRLCHA
ncbi:MAG TPA: dethiobiotin synthase [Gemmataceae bacterium]|nr:dethiobiotin synthase [Gemmataceae bacterium]